MKCNSAVDKNKLPIHATILINLKDTESKKSDTKECTLYDSIFMKFNKAQN